MTESRGVLRYNKHLGLYLHRVGTGIDDLPIYSDLPEGMAKFMNRRVKAKYQNVVAYVGGTGTGKSHLAVNVCMEQDPFFSLHTDYIYGGKSFAKKLKTHPSEVSPVSLFDEGSVILNSSNSAKKEDKMTTVLFDTMRSRGWSVHICIPKLRSLNNRVRDDHLMLIADCGCMAPLPGFKSRGFFRLYMSPNSGPFSTGRYWRPICYGIYPKLPKSVEEIYEQKKAQSQDTYLEAYINALLEEN